MSRPTGTPRCAVSLAARRTTQPQGDEPARVVRIGEGLRGILNGDDALEGRNQHLENLALAAFLLFLAIAVYRAAGALPPPRFEPLGPAFFPRVLGVGLGIAAVLLAVSTLLAMRREGIAPDAASKSDDHPVDVVAAVGGLGLLAAYIVTIEFRLVDYRVSTTVFLIAMATLLMRSRRFSSMAKMVATMLVAALVVHFAFTRIVLVDLP